MTTAAAVAAANAQPNPPPVVDPAAQTPSGSNQDFDAAFAEFMKDEPNPTPATAKGPNPTTPVEGEPPVVDPNETPEQKAAREAAEGDPGTELEGTPEEQAAAAAAAAEVAKNAPPQPQPPAQTDDAIRKLAEVLAANQQQRQPPPTPQPQPAPALYTPEEQAILTQYRNDYGDVARAEALVRKGEYAALATHIFKQIGDFIAPQMALLNQIADRVNYQQLTTDNPNYATERQAIEGWIGQQPDYLQQAYMGVMNHGTTEQVKNLFDRFRAETGTTAGDTPNPGNAPQANAGGTVAARAAPELSPQAKQAAQRLAPVGGKRSAVTQAAPTTFDDAFDTFAKQMAAGA